MIRSVFILLLLCAALSTSARAQTVRLAWGSPNGPANQPFVAGPVDLYVVVTGQSTPVLAVQFNLRITDQNPPCSLVRDSIPDAWRFDAAGCQAGRVCLTARGFDPTAPAPPPAGYQRITHLYNDLVYGREGLIFAEAYPAPVTTDPTHTYVALRVRFDHSRSVTDLNTSAGQCGDGAHPMYIYLTYATWVDSSHGEEHLYEVSREFVSWNGTPLLTKRGTIECSGPEPIPLFASLDTDVPECDAPTSVRTSSWGSLKAGYR